MACPTLRDRTFVRTIVLGAALLMGSLTGLAGVDHAAADTLIPRVDMGGPGGGGGGAVVDIEWAQTPNERSISLSESKEAPGGVRAGAPAPDEESERASAENRYASVTQAPWAELPNQTTF
jgi:hypothetical protein